MDKRWVFRVLFVVMLALAGASAAMQILRSGGAGGRAATDMTMLAKTALGSARLPGAPVESYEKPLLERLDAASSAGDAAERARALRRKAIWCSFRSLGCAAGALDALERIPADERRPAPADEAALLREVLLSERIEEGRVASLEGRLGEMRLGWFDHLLRERLYRHAGEPARAEAALDAAMRGATLAMVTGLLLMVLLGGGALAWMALLMSPARAAIVARLAEGMRSSHEPSEAREGAAPASGPSERPDAPARYLMVVVTFFAVSLALPLAVGPLALAGSPGPAARAGWTLALEGALLLLVVGAQLVFLRRVGLRLGFVGPQGGRSAPGGEGRDEAGAGAGKGRTGPLRALGVGALSYLLMWPVLLVVMMPLGELFERLGLPTRGHPIVEQLQQASGDPGVLALWLVIASVAAPVLEEAVFRGALHEAMLARFGGRAALLFVPFVFAVVHPQVGLGLVGVFVVGLALSLVRVHEGSLWPGVVLHAINNGVAMLLATAMLSG